MRKVVMYWRCDVPLVSIRHETAQSEDQIPVDEN